ncbi:hypothetical protein PLICRDRAFT_180399 [Plicaturopsis crispa FD-325 SS-3]|uniref:Uncharacterized protein n=1 Tax=Plicaturopsis crispa FD-325 SS-3 TaxID=944288 RepID=A0A0C9SKC5_PLICR|nr:hypothetical protein PLICRDRAFT_180399 [Plicaturopsis crispa FD-325 SS-3]
MGQSAHSAYASIRTLPRAVIPPLLTTRTPTLCVFAAGGLFIVSSLGIHVTRKKRPAPTRTSSSTSAPSLTSSSTPAATSASTPSPTSTRRPRPTPMPHDNLLFHAHAHVDTRACARAYLAHADVDRRVDARARICDRAHVHPLAITPTAPPPPARPLQAGSTQLRAHSVLQERPDGR